MVEVKIKKTEIKGANTTRTKTPSLSSKLKLPLKKPSDISHSLSRNISMFSNLNSQRDSRNDNDIVKKLIMKYNPELLDSAVGPEQGN